MTAYYCGRSTTAAQAGRQTLTIELEERLVSTLSAALS